MGMFDNFDIGGFGVNLFNGIQNRDAQRQANYENRVQSDREFEREKELANTSHQREVADLQAAGLNPVLSAGGNGAPMASKSAPGGMAAKIEMPDMMAYGISLKQLEQVDQKIAIDKQNSAAAISKSLSETDLNKMKKILAQKGMVRAELEGETADVIRNMIKFFKKNVEVPSLKNEMGSDPNKPDKFDNPNPLSIKNIINRMR